MVVELSNHIEVARTLSYNDILAEAIMFEPKAA